MQVLPQNNKKPVISDWFSGADTRIRTGDLILTKDALYLLSYISTLLHRATNIYYHIFGENARGIFKKIKKICMPCGGGDKVHHKNTKWAIKRPPRVHFLRVLLDKSALSAYDTIV